MSLVSLDHQRWAPVNVTTSSVPGILDAFYTLVTQANDYAGTPIATPLTSVTKRTSGGTTESMDWGFANASLGVKGQISGVNAARTPLMSASTNGSHTWTANTVMAGLTKNAGAYAAWDHASAPWTSGQSIGLSKFFNMASFTPSKVHGLVSNESVALFIEATTGAMFGTLIGALLDPESTGSLSAESDGRLYSVYVTGTSGLSTTMHGTSALGLAHTASNDANHFLTLTPGGSTCKRTNKLNGVLAASSTTTLTTPDGEPLAVPLMFYDTVNDRCLGRLREACVVRDAKMNQRQAPSSVDRWYYVAGSPSADSDAIGFLT